MDPNKGWGPSKIWGPGIDLRTPWKIFSLRPWRGLKSSIPVSGHAVGSNQYYTVGNYV